MYETYLLQEIKTRITARAGINHVTPSDCKHIAVELRKSVKKNVSETTLKRFFGFAAVSHGFSKYTMSALFEYANFHPEAPFEDRNILEPSCTTWENIHRKIGGITDYVLREIRNRSGLPYEMTISRKFAQHDLEEFYEGNTNFMCFIAQPGYGKTILLSHIVQKYFRDADAPYQNSIALFINAGSFYKAEQMKFDLISHLKNILGVPQNADLIAFLTAANTEQHKFFLIIDGFAELVLNKEAKMQLFDELVDFICALDHHPNIKVIMNMRSTMWVRFYDKIRHSAYLRRTWFKGNYFNDHDASNVPPLTEEELQEITEKTGDEKYSKINPVLKAQLKFPFHIHLYFQLRTEDPFLSYGSNIAFYELISRFIQEKIFKSNYYTEKVKFINRLVEISSYGQNAISVEKNLLIGEMMTFKNAYMELIADGILIEEKRSVDFFPKEFVSFLHPQIFEYFIYMELFNRFTAQGEVNQIFSYIQNNYKGSANRFILLQWAVRHFFRIENYQCIKDINKLELNNYERNYLVLFIAENLKYDLNVNPGKRALIKREKVHEEIIEGLSNLDYLDSCYSEGIQVLIEICDKDQNWVTYHTILSIIDILSLDAERIQKRIDELSPYQSLCENSFVNPLDFLYIVLAKIQGQPQSVSNLIAKVERLLENTTVPVSAHPNTITGIFYMLLLVTNLFYGAPARSAEILDAAYHKFPRLRYSRTPFATYMLLIYGIVSVRNRQFKKVFQVQNIIAHIASDKDKYGFTLYSESLLILLNAMIEKAQGNFNLSINHLETALEIFKRNQINVNVLLSYTLIMETYQTLGDLAKMNEYKYEKRCFQEENKIPKDILHHTLVAQKVE